MITFRSIFEELVQELKPVRGHLGVRNTIAIDDIVDWYGVDINAFKKFLDGSEIPYEPGDDPRSIYNSIGAGAPEAYYWLWKHKPDREVASSMKAIAKKDSYVLYALKEYNDYYKHIRYGYPSHSNRQLLCQ